MPTPRERRLFSEFERMKALRSPHNLFDFLCADLTNAQAIEFLSPKIPLDVIKKSLPDFLEPEEFEKLHPRVAPEKYLVRYKCKGLVRSQEKGITEEKITEEHKMEVVFGWSYPTEPPMFIWLTDIWHPNFKESYICIEGHTFAVGLTLDQIVLEVGRMIQYQNYNVNDPLNGEAAEWALQNPDRFPVDDRDILDARRRLGGRQEDSTADQLVEIMQPGSVEMQNPDQLIELI